MTEYEQQNRETVRMVKNLANHHFDGIAHSDQKDEGVLFNELIESLNKQPRKWGLEDVAAALAEVESLHLRLYEMERLTPQQTETANATVYRLFNRFLNYF